MNGCHLAVRRAPAMVIVALAVATALATPLSAMANPHGGFSSSTDMCDSCHAPHLAEAQIGLLKGPDDTTLCLACHDGSGSDLDIEREYAEGTATAHPIGPDDYTCSTCHTPHMGPAESNPSSLRVEGSEAATGTPVCGTCHGVGSAQPGGDMVTPIAASPHDSLDSTASPAGIPCRSCHAAHASPNDDLLLAAIVKDGLAADVDDANTLCIGCHRSATDGYPGAAVATDSTHWTVTTSSKAATAFPDAAGAGSACMGCHEPHDKGSGEAYARLAGDDLCRECHDVAGAVYGSGYSYQGGGVMDVSGHDDLVAGRRIVALSPGDTGGSAWESTTVPTPSAPGMPISGARLASVDAIDANRLVTGLQTTNGGYDYQMYRFHVGTEAAADSLRFVWTGYGEQEAGYPVVLSVWDPAASNWDQLYSGQVGTQRTLQTAVATESVDASGDVYLLASARNVRDSYLTVQPAVVALGSDGVTVTWQTAGMAESWVEWGATTAYGNLAGDSTLTHTHSVNITGLPPGVTHFRVRSIGRDGNVDVSGDLTFATPPPALTPVADVEAYPGADIPFSWAAPSGITGPFTYQLHVWSVPAGVDQTLPWQSGTSAVVNLPADAHYYWTVTAKDSGGVDYGPAAPDDFWIVIPSSSCPFLFTWDGDEFAFEADLFGAGKLGLNTAAGPAPANPDEYYLLDNVPQPIEEGGPLEFRMVEERYETDYLDDMALYAVDVPAGLDVYAEKPQSGETMTTFDAALHTVGDMSPPVSAVHVQTGADVSAKIATRDSNWLVLNDDRNIGFEYQTLELDLGDVRDAPQLKVVMDAVSAFPTTPEGTARAANFGYRTRLQVQDETGAWVTVPSADGALPKPPEFSRPYVFDISDIWRSDSRKVRFTFLFKTYVDSIQIDTTSDVPVSLAQAPLVGANLGPRGFDGRTTEDDLYEYLYGEPSGRFAHFAGAFTRYGDVSALLDGIDDRFVVLGGGDELTLRFEDVPAPSEGTTRRYLMYAHGYYKDAKVGLPLTVEPLPFAGMSAYPYPETEHYPDDAEHQEYLAEYNTRVYETAGMHVESVSTTAIGALSDLVGEALAALRPSTTGIAEEPGSTLHRSLNTDFVALEAAIDAEPEGGSCGACHAPHGELELGETVPALARASDGRLCLGDGSGCHSLVVRSGGVDIEAAVNASTSSLAHHDVTREIQWASGGKVECTNCHNPHRDNLEAPFSNPDDISQAGALGMGAMVSSAGEVYVLAGAQHDGVPPTISGIARNNTGVYYASPIVTWTTNEAATSWIDWGTTAAYELGNETSGTPYGNASLVLSHSVTMSGLTPGVTYHYRVRSTDSGGNTSYGPDTVYTPVAPPPTPVLHSQPDTTTNEYTLPITFSWDATAAPDADPVEYRVFVEEQEAGEPTNYSSWDSGWISDTSWLVTIWTEGWWQNPYVTWQVKARDSVHTQAESAWSAVDSFNVYGPVYSCPELYTWDGDGFAYVTDVMGLGPLGVKKGRDVYLNPEPVEDTIIPQGMLVPKNGQLELHVTDEKREIEFIDEVGLAAIDHPQGTRVVINDLHWGAFGGGRDATRIYTLSDPQPVRTTYERFPVFGTETIPETDISELVAVEGDGVLADSGMYDDNWWTFDLGQLDDPAQIKLVMSGWMEYANPEQKAAWVASGKRPPKSCFEVQDADGNWVDVGEAPHIANYTKTVAYDFTDLFPEGVTEYKIRMRLYMRMHLDWVAVDTTPDAAVTTTVLPMSSAELSYKGMAEYTHSPYPYFDWDGIVPGEAPKSEGAFTRFGDVFDLLQAADDMFVIMDTGDDIAMSFDAGADPAPGMERTYMIHTDGYHQTITRSVDPMPFHAMSNYPYPETEAYPQDAAHWIYRLTYNTRIHTRTPGGDPSLHPMGDATASSAEETQALSWTRGSSPGAPVKTGATTDPAASPKTDEYSVDTDAMYLVVTRADGSLSTVAPVSGRESSSTGVPATPETGTAASSGRLAAVDADDGSYLRTDLATVDRDWNWQIFEFDISGEDMSTVRSVSYYWVGHGEAKSGYPTRVALWDHTTSGWVTKSQAQMGTDTTVSDTRMLVAPAFCLSCHDGSAPAGVVFPGAPVNISTLWTSTTATGDFHGARAGTGFGSAALKPPYRRTQDALPCSACHDSHGSSSLYHVPGQVNGSVVPAVTNGNQMQALCAACHAGGEAEWHAGCYDCHDYDEHGVSVSFTSGRTCLTCHGHGRTYVHEGSCAGCHGSGPADTWRTF